MAEVRRCRLDDARDFAAMRDFFEADNPNLNLRLVSIDGHSTLRAEHGGMRVYWIFRGQGEVFLPAGYRTQEGDGQRLPDTYRPDQLDPAVDAALELVQRGLKSFSPAALPPVEAILGRRRGTVFVGDYGGELWRLDHLPRPWSSDPEVQAVLESLFVAVRDHGYSTRQGAGHEPLQAGDQVIVCGDQTLDVRGSLVCLSMENLQRRTSHVSAVRRLRYLADTAGGCNPDFDPFRRLPLTWYYARPGEPEDGPNWVNSHVVNIPKETSPSHFHPPRGISGKDGQGDQLHQETSPSHFHPPRGISGKDGQGDQLHQETSPSHFHPPRGISGKDGQGDQLHQETSPSHFHPPRGIDDSGSIPQREMYLVLDPAAYRLNTWGRKASLVVFPDLRDLRRYEEHPLEPGMFVYIPPGTGHRGLDVLVNVLTIPGFKPHNEYYIDRDIRDQAGGVSPYNENLLAAKNYRAIEDLL